MSTPPEPEPATGNLNPPSSQPPTWAAVVGAIFGGIMLLALLAFTFLAGTKYHDFICNSYTILAFAFSLGSALAVAFLGGYAAAQGQIGTTAQNNSLTFSAGGGIA